MYRKAIAHLTTWYKQADKKPLLLSGARQVGKSTLVRLFCKKANIDLIELNLEKQKLKSCQVNSIDLDALLIEIEDLHQKTIKPKSTLIFLDEIQAQPEVLKYLRYFYEEKPELSVIAAGSLLEFYLSDEDLNIPVGRITYFFLGPMDFEEYLLARKQKILLKRLKDYQNLTAQQHEQLLGHLKEYLYVGGMPAAVKTYCDTNKINTVRQKHLDILQTYRDDFLKYAKQKQNPILGKIFDFVPYHLGQKVKFNTIDSSLRSEQIQTAMQLLIKARVLLPIYHCNANNLPLSTFEDQKVFKLFFLDVGLALAAQKVSWQELHLLETELNQRGSMFEQFIAQHLLFRSYGFEEPHLNYWLKDKTPGKAEIDFLFQEGLEIYPVEVKAGLTGSLKSLWQFIKEKNSTKAIQFYGDEFKIEDAEYKENNLPSSARVKLFKVPHYLAPKILKILK